MRRPRWLELRRHNRDTVTVVLLYNCSSCFVLISVNSDLHPRQSPPRKSTTKGCKQAEHDILRLVYCHDRTIMKIVEP